MARLIGPGYFIASTLSSPTQADFVALLVGNVEKMRWSTNKTTATGDNLGFQSKIPQTVTTTGEVYGAQISPRLNSAIGALSLIGMSVDPILKGSTTGTVTNLRGLQVTLTDDNSAGRTITNQPAMIRLWHQLAAHTFTNGNPVGISMEAAGGIGWGFAMKFADDSGSGLADLASATATINGVIKVQIGSTTGYIPTYATYTPS